MTQLVIDPASVGEPTKTSTAILLPAQVRRFGFVPDLSLCQPGDLVLFASRKPNIAQKWITRVQQKIGLADVHAKWTHAGLFLYGDHVLEAVLKHGVVTRSLYLDIPSTVLRVRRAQTLRPDERYLIALCAQRMLGTRYSTKTALKAALQTHLGRWDSYVYRVARPTVICSKVYYDAFVEITRRLLADCPFDDFITPAHLSATPDLTDVNIPWLKVG